MAHTPGPWKAHFDDAAARRVFMPSDVVEIKTHAPGRSGLVACLYRHNFYEEDADNARLIAAAPKLLAVAKAFLLRWEGVSEQELRDHFGKSSMVAEILAAREAVAEAEGNGPEPDHIDSAARVI